MSRVACQIRVTGHVQGVFFRAWAAEHARELGVVGWIRNASDGSVEAHLEGDKHAVQRLIDHLHQGPPAARVERVDVEATEPKAGDRFEIRH